MVVPSSIDLVDVVAACIIGRCPTVVLLLVVVPSSIDITGHCCTSSIDIVVAVGACIIGRCRTNIIIGRTLLLLD